MSFKSAYFKYLVGIFVMLVVASCSTEKDALINKGYHNMTARYNGYYNAGVIINEALESYRNEFSEDYNEIIPLDLYPSAEDASALFPDMDDAIGRCETVILRHSMPNPLRVSNKSEEHCRWIDDNWLVIGKAHYIKREYEKARERLKYVSDSYDGEASVYEARIWLAKTHIALGEYAEAKRILVLVENSIKASEEEKEKDEKKKRPSKFERQRAKKANKKKDKGPAKFPKRLKLDYEVAMAELAIAQEDTKTAIKHLETAIGMCRNKKRRARYMFVLAQLYGESGNNQQASYYYSKVARSSALYEMRFTAKIRKALTSTGGSEELEKELNKMLKDGKNLEYKDQIYYALAELEMKKPNVAKAVEHYSSSVRWSINNDQQKGISYLRLADIFFEKKDYLKAQKYYDSCVQALPEEYENYEYLKNKAEGLSDLVFNYETVVFEDSVQRIGQMSEREREKFLEKTLEQILAEEERKRIEKEQQLLAQQERVNQQQAGATGGKGKGYFANPKQVAEGFNDFRGLWGQRPLEDNWRRANKNALVNFENGTGEEVDTTEAEGLTVEDLMKDIPLTQADIDSSNNRILNSLYQLGIIYKEQLKEEPEAISYFQAVIDRGIEHPKVLPSLYQLYLIYSSKGDARANQYKTAITKNYADSEIAKIILDPDYLKKKELKDREELTEYSNTFRSYRQKRYGVVITKCNKVINGDKENSFINKYYLLKAFAISKVNAGNTESIKKPLQELYDLSPESEEGMQAKVYLDQLKSGGAITEPDEDVGEKTPYVFEEDSKYFFILSIPAGLGSVNDAKIKVANFNSAYFGGENLSLKNSPLGESHDLIIVRSFKDLVKAKVYLNSFKSDKSREVLGTFPEEFEIFLISTKNFAELFKTRDTEGYLEFYSANY